MCPLRHSSRGRLHWLPGLLLIAAVTGCGQGTAETDDGLAIQVPQGNEYLSAELAERLAIPVTFRHSRPGPVTLEVVSKSCGCLDVILPKSPVPPGQEVQISVQLPKAPGHFSRTFVLQATDPDQTSVQRTVEVDYQIYADQEVYPDRILREWNSSSAQPLSLQFRRHHRKSAGVAAPKLIVGDLPEQLTVESVSEAIVRDQSAEIALSEWSVVLRPKFSANEPAATFGKFTIGVEGEEPAHVQYEWIYMKRVVLTPKKLYFGTTRVGQSSNRTSLITVRADAVPAITEINSSSPAFQAREVVSESNASSVRQLEVTFAPATAGEHHGTLTIVTDSTNERELKLDVSGLAASP